MKQLEMLYSSWEYAQRTLRKLLKPGVLVVLRVGFLAYRPGSYWSRNVFGPWCYLYVVLALGFALYGARKISWTVFPLLLISLISGVWLFADFRNAYNGQFDLITFLVLGKNALASMVTIIGATFFLTEAPAKYTKLARWTLVTLLIASVVMTSLQSWTGQVPGGFVGNPSMNGCLMASLLPLLVDVPGGFLFGAATAFAVFVTHASIPIGILAMELFFGLDVLVTAAPAAYVTLFFLLAAYVFFQPLGGHHGLLNDNGRMDVWRLAYGWWQAHTPTRMFGAGLGSGAVFIQRAQREAGHVTGLFPWLHSDFLQIGFELGYAGLVAALGVYAWLVARTAKRRALTASLLGFGIMGACNWPLHQPHCCLSILLLTYVIVRER